MSKAIGIGVNINVGVLQQFDHPRDARLNYCVLASSSSGSRGERKSCVCFCEGWINNEKDFRVDKFHCDSYKERVEWRENVREG
jgi:hypothetical protein